MVSTVAGRGKTPSVVHRTPEEKVFGAFRSLGIEIGSAGTNADGQPQWEACCPSHGDSRASLAISLGRDGRVLLHCHAGCERTAILPALGLTESDLFPADSRPKSRSGKKGGSKRLTANGKPRTSAASDSPTSSRNALSESDGQELPMDALLAAVRRDGIEPQELPPTADGCRRSGFPCPNHPELTDKKPLAIVTETQGRAFVANCESGCNAGQIVHQFGLTVVELFGRLKNKQPRGFETAAEAAEFMGRRIRPDRPQPDFLSNYPTADGQPYFMVARWDLVDAEGQRSKETRPLRLNDRKLWECRFPEGLRPLMDLPKILAADPAERVFVLEGEKKTLLARDTLGILATCCAGGSKAAKQTDWAPLARFAEVIILPDNDRPGKAFTIDVARRVHALNPTAVIRIVELPGLKKSGDLVDWVENHGDAAEPESMRDELLRLIDSTAPLDPAALGGPVADDVGDDETAENEPQPQVAVVEEDDTDPRALAKKILPRWDSEPLLRRWQERWYRYDHDCGFYREQTEESVSVMVVQRVDAEFQRLAKEEADFSEDGTAKKLKVSNKLIGDVKTALMSLDGVLLDADQSAPFWIGEPAGRPDAGMMASFPNGRLNLAASNAQLDDNRPDLFVTGATNFDFNPSATCSGWLQFLSETFEGDKPSIDALHEYAGLCLTNVTRYHKALLLMGPPRSGKGIILRILEELVGSQQTCSVSLTGLAERFGLEPLIGKKLAVIGDAVTAGKDAKRPIEVLLGTIGEDLQTAEQKFRSANRSFRLAARWAIATNELPRLPNASGAIAARLLILKTGPSKAGQEDFGLRDRLLSELPGIAVEAVRGWHRLQARGGFVHPERGTEELEELRRDSSPVRAFIEDCCEFDINEREYCNALYLWFRKWADINGIVLSAWSEQRFGRELNAAFGDKLQKIRPGSGDDRRRAYAGIRVNTKCF